MLKYHFKKRICVEWEEEARKVRGKVAIKTVETDWVDTSAPVLVQLSIHSAFHEGIEGEMKLRAFMEALKASVRSQIVILLTEGAHEQALGLKYGDAKGICRRDAEELAVRFQEVFEGCDVVYWEEFIRSDPRYEACKQKVLEQYKADREFRELLVQDAESTYSGERREVYLDKVAYVEKTVLDLLEQACGFWVLVEKGIRYQFYPGRPYASMEYLDWEGLAPWIRVFVSIEKKWM